MNNYELIFWISFFLIFYTYLGYPLLLYLILKSERLRYFIRIPENAGKIYLNPEIAGYSVLDQKFPLSDYSPLVTVVISAYNEEKFIEDKIKNCLSLDYPPDKIEFIFLTDGSTDKTPNIVSRYAKEHQNIKLIHSKERKGKLKAIEDAFSEFKGEIIVFSDANSFYNKEAIKVLVQPFQFEKVGCVAGEKRVVGNDGKLDAEGLYWKYESFLKKIDSEIYSIVGAAGEIFAIRKDLFEKLPENTINEDFVLTMNIASKGYRVIYAPDAYAIETPTTSIFEEFKRRIRISTGGIQSIFILKNLFDIRRHKFLSFQFISHRILRWTLAPISTITLVISNIFIIKDNPNPFYELTLFLQFILYFCVVIGLISEVTHFRIKPFYLFFSFFLMNFASIISLIFYPMKKHSNIWKKVKR